MPIRLKLVTAGIFATFLALHVVGMIEIGSAGRNVSASQVLLSGD